MLTSLGNGNIAHGWPSQPLRGVKQPQGFATEAVENNTWVEGTGTVHILNYCGRHSSLRACTSTSKRTSPFGGIRIDKDVFDDNVSADKGISCTGETEDDEEVGLVPQKWRLLQDNLHRTKSELKLQMRLQARENELKRAEELQLKRQQLEEAGKSLKERIRQQNTISNQEMQMDHSSRKRDIASLNTFATSNIEEPDKPGQTHESSKKKFELDCLFSEDEIACLKRGAPDLSKLDCDKWLPLQVLAAAGQFFFLVEYLKSDLELNAVDQDGYTPIHRAILGRKETAVTQLLRAGADPFIIDKDGASYLHYSAQTGSLNLVRLFVKYGVDMNHPDQEGWTALHIAVLTAREEIVRHLLLSGADKHRKTKDGCTPFDICLAIGKGYRTFAVAKSLKRFPKTGRSFNLEPKFQEDSTPSEKLGATEKPEIEDESTTEDQLTAI